MAFAPPPAPKTALGHYRMLSPTASIRVSPLCLGAMNFGDAWKDFMGECDQKSTNEILDFFYESGGNFIDTANNYQKEESEKWIGEWMQKRGNRDQMVIATKFTTCKKSFDPISEHLGSKTYPHLRLLQSYKVVLKNTDTCMQASAQVTVTRKF